MNAAPIENVAEAARRYFAAGLLVLPCVAARKFTAPGVGKWGRFVEQRPDAPTFAALFDCRHDALCIVCGRASGNVECIDFDMAGEAFAPWWAAIPEPLRDVLVIEQSPSGGYHVVYRCEHEVAGNLKLAIKHVDGEPHTLIETRGEGGLFLCAPSPGYVIQRGDLAELPLLSGDDRQALLDAAVALGEVAERPERKHATGTNGDGRPGDEFNAQADISGVLKLAGWKHLRTVGDNQHWQRPGKTGPGASATFNGKVFYVFSSNADPFEAGRGYSAFAVYAMLEHGGDFKAAAKALGRAHPQAGAYRASRAYRADEDDKGDGASRAFRAYRAGAEAWPTLRDEALHGVAGEIVRAILPHTEADPAALLMQTLATFGAIVGRSVAFTADGAEHHLNEFIGLTGDTAKGRKGTSWNHVRRVFEPIVPAFMQTNIAEGLSSGEGLIHATRDASADGADPGVADKRLLVIEGELGRPLAAMRREGNTLSAVLRCAWDGGQLRVMTRANPIRSTGAHVSIVGHVTKLELLKLLSDSDTGNGFANRFLWVCSRRSKCLPDGGQIETVDFRPMLEKMGAAVDLSHTGIALTRDEEAGRLWHAVYPQLSEGLHGLLGMVTSRAEAHAMRLASMFAVLDLDNRIREQHLKAALAVWAYCMDSAAHIFGARLGDRVADDILDALKDAGEGGMTQSELRGLFSGHKSSNRMMTALGMLASSGLVVAEPIETAGRPATRWRVTPAQ